MQFPKNSGPRHAGKASVRVRTAGLLAGLLALGLPLSALAQVDYNAEDAKRIKSAEVVGALGDDLFGESVNFYTGATSFRHLDLSIPGNGSLPMQVARSRGVEDLETKHNPLGREFGDWELDLPWIGGVFLENVGWAVSTGSPSLRCSSPTSQLSAAPKDYNSFQASRYWQGYSVNIPGQGTQPLLRKLSNDTTTPTAGGPWRWETKGQVQIACLSTLKNPPLTGAGYTGEGFLALAPDGTKYWFDYLKASHAREIRKKAPYTPQYGSPPTLIEQRKEIRLYASRIEDRFGNSVTFQRTNGLLTSISASDGRSISFTYSAGRIQTATDGQRTIGYGYAATGHLSTVTLPDLSQWSIQLAAAEPVHYDSTVNHPQFRNWDPNSPECGWKRVLANSAATGTITHPSGAVGTFTFRYQRHVRASVPDSHCSYDKLLSPTGMPSGLGEPDEADWEFQSWTPRTFDVIAVRSKVISGPGVGPLQWEYSYGAGEVAAYDYGSHTRWTEVVEPGNRKRVFTFGNRYGISEGQLQSLKTYDGATLLETKAETYVTAAEAPSHPFQHRVGEDTNWNGDTFASEFQRPLKRSVITRQGVDFTWEAQEFDTRARVVRERKFSSLGYSRFEGTTYQDYNNLWVLGQVSQKTLVTSTGTVLETLGSTEFDPATGLPIVFRGVNGLFLQRVTYNADGTPATVKDGRDLVTTLSSWYRGVPRNIQFADGTTRSATLNTVGWVTSMTDENGYATSYGYDAAGRISLMTPPGGDSVAWLATSSSFTRATAAAYGLPAGHWKHLVTRGNYRKETFYDALWRPRMTREYDTANEAGTRRVSVVAYAPGGQTSFASYPATDAASVSTLLQGVWTEYDALGRVQSVSQDSEQGLLTTLTEYLSGFETRVTNPRGHRTTTAYQVFDQPDTGAPVNIAAPEGVLTAIARDDLGMTTSVTRSGSWAGFTPTAVRRYVYDTHRRMCKQIEPETGATVMGYDAAGNLAWSAAGLALPATGGGATVCDDARAVASGSGRRVDRSYDSRNRPLTLSFPDGRGNQTFAYTPDGLPSQVTTNNSAGGTPVVNTYSYNRRRMLTAETLAQPGWYSWGIGYGYDASGHLASQSYPTGLSVGYAPNALGQATQAGSYATGVQYFPNGAIKQFTYGNGIVHTLTQNARQLPLASTDSGGALSQQYAYDRNGNVSSVTDSLESARSKTMSYDSLDRLISASSTSFGGTGTHQFGYDPLDNLRSWTLGGVKDLANYVYSAENRLTEVRNSAGNLVHQFSYDVQGNITSRNTVPHDFDFGNRLRAVPGIEDYRYDGSGRRVQTTKASGARTLWMYAQNGQVLFSSKLPAGGGQTTHENVYLGGSLVATIDHNWPSNSIIATKYQHTDALGSPVAVSNESGVVLAGERTNYDPYGGAIGKVVDGIGYTGHVMDSATGLTYMQQRYYDQGVGRFLSVDPIGVDANSGALFNRYVYAAANPYRYFDPDGRCTGSRITNADGTCRSTGENTTMDTVGSKKGSSARDVSVPEKVMIEASGYATMGEAADAAEKAYLQDDKKKKKDSELQLGLVEISDGNWGYLTPGWGPENATRVNLSPLLKAYLDAGLTWDAWMHSHFDSQQNFSATDFAFVWGRTRPLVLANRNGEVRILTDSYLKKELRKLPFKERSGKLGALQKLYETTGLPGEEL